MSEHPPETYYLDPEVLRSPGDVKPVPGATIAKQLATIIGARS